MCVNFRSIEIFPEVLGKYNLFVLAIQHQSLSEVLYICFLSTVYFKWIKFYLVFASVTVLMVKIIVLYLPDVSMKSDHGNLCI